MSKLKIEDIISQCEQHQWKLLSSEYKNLQTPLKFQCNKGHQFEAPWAAIRDMFICPICEQEKVKIDISYNVPDKKEKRVLALDQATNISGFSVFDGTTLRQYGTYTAFGSQHERINKIKKWVLKLVEAWHPDEIGIEGISTDALQNLKTTEALCRLAGVLIDALYERGIRVNVIAVNQWRKACGVKGNIREEQKQSMQQIVKQRYNINVTEDEADAIGIGTYLVGDIKPIVNIIQTRSWE